MDIAQYFTKPSLKNPTLATHIEKHKKILRQIGPPLCTVMELLFRCQQKAVYNLMDHPVHTTTFWLFVSFLMRLFSPFPISIVFKLVLHHPRSPWRMRSGVARGRCSWQSCGRRPTRWLQRRAGRTASGVEGDTETLR